MDELEEILRRLRAGAHGVGDFMRGGLEQYTRVNAPRTGGQIAGLLEAISSVALPRGPGGAPSPITQGLGAVREAGLRDAEQAQGEMAARDVSTAEKVGRIGLGEIAPTIAEYAVGGGAIRKGLARAAPRAFGREVAEEGASRTARAAVQGREALRDAAAVLPLDAAIEGSEGTSTADAVADLTEGEGLLGKVAEMSRQSAPGRVAFGAATGLAGDLGLRTAGMAAQEGARGARLAADVAAENAPRGRGGHLIVPGKPGRVRGEVEQGLPGRWVSPLVETVEGAQNAAPAEQWLGILRKGAGSQNEREWSGIEAYLESRKGERVTRDELLGFLDENGIRLTETVRGTNLPPEAQGKSTEELLAHGDRLTRFAQEAQAAGRRDEAEQLFRRAEEFTLFAEAREGFGPESAPKFESYVQPGGENYREVLIQLDDQSTAGLMPAARRYQDERQGFRSAHWDEPNVLTHLRMTDRRVATPYNDREKTLFLEEIQSDWHQKGRERGYRRPVTVDDFEVTKTNDEWHVRRNDLTNTLILRGDDAASAEEAAEWGVRQYGGAINSSGVPDAPYKRTEDWVGLGFRRALQEAAEGGYDRIAWVSGEQAADLYDLRKQVSRIEWHPESKVLQVFDPDGHPILDAGLPGKAEAEELPDLIGKDAARALVDAEPESIITAEAVQEYHDGYRYDITNREAEALDWVAQKMDAWGETFDEVAEQHRFGPEISDFLDNVKTDMLGGSAGYSTSGWHAISGDDLAVGGEGMETFYNRIVPNVVKRETKRLGVSIEPVRLGPSESYRATEHPSGQWIVQDEYGDVRGARPTKAEADDFAARLNAAAPERDPTNLSIRLTPQARERILNEGQRIGATPAEMVGGLALGSLGVAAGGSAVAGSQGDDSGGGVLSRITREVFNTAGGRPYREDAVRDAVRSGSSEGTIRAFRDANRRMMAAEAVARARQGGGR